jgi:hypothetical protein
MTRSGYFWNGPAERISRRDSDRPFLFFPYAIHDKLAIELSGTRVPVFRVDMLRYRPAADRTRRRYVGCFEPSEQALGDAPYPNQRMQWFGEAATRP